MYTKNAVGPNTEPCGTPLPTLSLELSRVTSGKVEHQVKWNI